MRIRWTPPAAADLQAISDYLKDHRPSQIDWDLIESMLPDMLRVVVSIRTGAILPSDVLRRLGSHSRKNRLYFALRELGRAVRSMFLLRYLSDLELRHVINTARTKSERFNKFVQWVAFGGDSVIAENMRDEQRKFIKYNHVVANLLAFHNVVAITHAVRRMEAEGFEVRDECVAELSPYQTERINRFGHYALNFSRTPAAPSLEFRKPPIGEQQKAFRRSSSCPPQPHSGHNRQKVKVCVWILHE
jgi:hypothetical protein